MKLFLRIAILFLLCLQTASSISQRWDHFYGSSSLAEYSCDIIETYDKGYLICGGYNNLATWLIKTDINGYVLWEKTIDADLPNIGDAIVETFDHGYVIAGGMDTNLGFDDPFVMKLNECGEKEWCTTFPGFFRPYDSWVEKIIEAENKDLVFIANQFGTLGENPLFLIKLDSLGQTKWKMPILTIWAHPNTIQPWGFDLIETSDAGYLISCDAYWTHPWDTVGEIKWLHPTFIKVDENGYEEWVYPFGLQDTILGMTRSTVILTENSYVGIGAFRSEIDIIHPLLMSFNSLGEELNYLIFDSQQIDSSFIEGAFVQSIHEQNDSLLICIGEFEVPPDNAYPVTEVVMDTAIFCSSPTFYYHVIHPNTRDPFKLAVTFDRKILSSSSYVFTPDNWDIYLTKMNMHLEQDSMYPGNYTYDSLCPIGITTDTIYINDCWLHAGISEYPVAKENDGSIESIPITVYPNPAYSEITVILKNMGYNTDIALTCYDITGQTVLNVPVRNGRNDMRLDITHWTPGLYMAVVTIQGRVAGEKRFVVMK